MSSPRFYLGTHRPNWLWEIHDTPLFVSHRRLKDRVSPYPKATTPWALDSGGFTELQKFGKWETTPEEYVAAVRRYDRELGCMEWAAPQDWMCEPVVIKGGWFKGQYFVGTGLSVAEHQARTIENFLTLRELAPDLGFIPVLQGWELGHYLAHAEAYAAAGVDLAAEPIVGVGSVCRRQASAEIAGIFDRLSGLGINMHGFGVKSDGFSLYADQLTSADSMAWSFGARQDARQPGHSCPDGKNTCANCLHAALAWRNKVLGSLNGRQTTLALYGAAS